MSRIRTFEVLDWPDLPPDHPTQDIVLQCECGREALSKAAGGVIIEASKYMGIFHDPQTPPLPSFYQNSFDAGVAGASTNVKTMFGKIFKTTFTGSLYGAGPKVFAVWSYIIAYTDEAHQIELNPSVLANTLGMTVEEVKTVIERFCAPDPASRTGDHEGRKLLHQHGFTYFVVNHLKYRSIRNEDDRREYFRIKQAEHRAKRQGMSNQVSKTVKDGLSQSKMSTQAEAEAEESTSTSTSTSTGESKHVKASQSDCERLEESRTESTEEKEERLLKDCLSVFGKAAMEEFGGLWRLRIREAAGVVEEVLQLVREDLKTRAIADPSEHAKNLWFELINRNKLKAREHIRPGVTESSSANDPNFAQAFELLREELNLMYQRKPEETVWDYREQSLLVEISRRPKPMEELRVMQKYRSRIGKFFPQSLGALLERWNDVLDRARTFERNRE